MSRDIFGGSTSGDFQPPSDDTTDLGAPNKRFKHGYFVDVSTANHPSVDQALTNAVATDLQGAYNNGTGAINLAANKPLAVNDGEVVVETGSSKMTIDSGGIGTVNTAGGLPPGVVVRTDGQSVADFKYDGVGLYKNLDMQDHSILRVTEPSNPTDAATKNYVDTTNTLQKGYDLGDGSVLAQAGKPLDFSGDVLVNGANVTDSFADLSANKLNVDGTLAMTGELNMGSWRIKQLADPVDAQDASTKNYADASVADLLTKTQNISATETDATKTVMTQQLVMGSAVETGAVTSFTAGVNLNTGTCGFSFTVNEPLIVTHLSLALSSWNDTADQKLAGIWLDGVQSQLVAAIIKKEDNDGVEAFAEIQPLRLEENTTYIVAAFQDTSDFRHFSTVVSPDINFVEGRNNYLTGPDPLNPPPNVFGYPDLGGAVFGFANFRYSKVSDRQPVTCGDVFCQNVYASNTLGVVLCFGGNIGTANSNNYLVANSRPNEGTPSNLQPYVIQVSPVVGLVSVSFTKASAAQHTFKLSRITDIDNSTAVEITDFVLDGRIGWQDTAFLVSKGEGLVIRHVGGATQAAGNVLLNLYLRPVGQNSAGANSSGVVSGPIEFFDALTDLEGVVDTLTA